MIVEVQGGVVLSPRHPPIPETAVIQQELVETLVVLVKTSRWEKLSGYDVLV